MEKWEMESLKDAQQYISERIMGGTDCPCCEQHVQAYKFNFHKGMVFVLCLIELAVKTGKCDKDKWVHVERYLTEKKSNYKGYHPKLEHWGLIERHPDQRGFWRLTSKGSKYLEGLISVPKSAILFNGECLGLVGEKNFIGSIVNNFDYSSMIKQLWTVEDSNIVFNRWKEKGAKDE